MTQPAFDPRAYWEDRLSKEYDLTGVGYRGLGPEFNAAMYRVRAKVFARVVRRLSFPPEPRVLDIGSGTGFYVERWLERSVGRLVASDITDVAVNALAGRFPSVDVRRLDIGDSDPLPGERFDVVSAFDVLFHIVDDERYAIAIANVASVLDPGGWFVFSDNFLRAGTVRAKHQVSRSLEDISAVLTASGFVIVRRVPMFVLMNGPVDTRSAFLKRRWERLAKRLASHPERGRRAGAVLYPVELALTAVLRESPSTEVMVCRKR